MAVISHVWRPSVELEGERWRRLPPAAVFVLGAAVMGFVLTATAWSAASAARAATYAGVLLAVGTSVFAAVVHDGRGTAFERERLRRLVGSAAVVGVLASLVQLAIQAASLAGRGWTGVFDGEAVERVLRSNLHAATAVRLCGLVLLVYAAERRADSAPTARLLTVNGVFISLASFLVTGHAATREPRLLAVIVDLVHTLSASVWVGGLVALLLVMRQRRRAHDAAGGAAIVARYSALMGLTIAALLVSAVGLALLQLSLDELFSTQYGGVLLAKTGLVAAVLGIGAYNHRRLVPAIEASDAGWSLLGRTVAVEVALIAAVIVVTGVLAGTAT